MLARELFPLFKIRNIKKSCGILDLSIGKSTADGFNTVVENQRNDETRKIPFGQRSYTFSERKVRLRFTCRLSSINGKGHS